MAMNISVELMSGKVYPMEVQPTMTIRELKEEMKAFHRWEDEITKILGIVEIIVDGKK